MNQEPKINRKMARINKNGTLSGLMGNTVLRAFSNDKKITWYDFDLSVNDFVFGELRHLVNEII